MRLLPWMSEAIGANIRNAIVLNGPCFLVVYVLLGVLQSGRAIFQGFSATPKQGRARRSVVCWLPFSYFLSSPGLCCSVILLWRELLPFAKSSYASCDDLKCSALLQWCRSIPCKFLCSLVGIEETKRGSRSMRTTSSMTRA
jgi:hypothetical protein